MEVLVILTHHKIYVYAVRSVSEGQESDIMESVHFALSSLAVMMNSSAENEMPPVNTIERSHICTKPVCRLIGCELETVMDGALWKSRDFHQR